MNKYIIGSLLIILFSLSACRADEQPGVKGIENSSKPQIIQETTPSVEPDIHSKPKPNDLIFNETHYNYDVVTGATKTTFGSNPKPMYSYEEKLTKMFWTNQPPLGLMVGNYFTNEGFFDVGNKGIVEIVTDFNGTIINVEFQEYGAENYYQPTYAGANKRLSDYAFFQAKNPRTDETLVTVVNGITFVEEQMRKENRIDGNFKTVKGSSTSARQGLIAIASELVPIIRQPSATQYIGYAEDLGEGLIGRLQLTTIDDKIETVRYDEYFADQPEKITDEQLKPYYRQSKYYSLNYNEETNHQFSLFADQLAQKIIETQTLSISDSSLMKHPSFTNYQNLAQKVDSYKTQ